jgi:signal transduction histidine kinase
LLSGCGGLMFGSGVASVLVVALATGLVSALCHRPVIIVFTAGLAVEIVAARWGPFGWEPASEAGLLAVALVSGLGGEAFRRLRVSQRRFAEHRVILKRRSDLARRRERERIADELHDIVAHDITMMVLHARALELSPDDDARRTSQAAIIAAGTQALADIRRILWIVEMPSETSSRLGPSQASLTKVLRALCSELEALGSSVALAVPANPEISMIVETTLARVAREAVTNVIKHGPAEPFVRISLTVDDHSTELCVRSPLPGRRRFSRSGYGLSRMRERVALLGGEFSAGPDGDEWLVYARVPERVS